MDKLSFNLVPQMQISILPSTQSPVKPDMLFYKLEVEPSQLQQLLLEQEESHLFKDVLVVDHKLTSLVQSLHKL